MSLLLLPIVPAGFASVHKYIQVQNDVFHVTASLTTYLSKRGTLQPSEVDRLVQEFVQEEVASQALPLEPDQFSVRVTRENGSLSDEELTAYDTFQVAVDYPRPWLVSWLQAPDIHVELTGTMEPVPHYKEG
jgi:hypothetical protein